MKTLSVIGTIATAATNNTQELESVLVRLETKLVSKNVDHRLVWDNVFNGIYDKVLKAASFDPKLNRTELKDHLWATYGKTEVETKQKALRVQIDALEFTIKHIKSEIEKVQMIELSLELIAE